VWEQEFALIGRLAEDLESRPPLPSASPEELETHSRQIQEMQDLLALMAALPPDRLPDVEAWDDLLAPFWRRLFARGDDIHRYLLADLWRQVLLRSGQTDRALRTLTQVAASAKNFYLYYEALALCQEGRDLARHRPSAGLVNLVTLEGGIHFLRGDLESARRAHTEALALLESVPEEEVLRWQGATKTDFFAQVEYNILEALVEQGLREPESRRDGYLGQARALLSALDEMPKSPEFRRILPVAHALVSFLGSDVTAARGYLALLDTQGSEGPYRYSLALTRCRHESRLCGALGDWEGAYGWIRQALQLGARYTSPGEEILVLEQALAVLTNLHTRSAQGAESHLVADLVQLLEDKDWYTGRSHSRSVSRLAVLVGQALNDGGGVADLAHLEAAGLVHDIGKLMCPWSLLNKIAPISPKERRLLQNHSRDGAALLRRVGMESLAQTVEEHHEHVDGTGYPNGRPPELSGAIVGLCDVFEASITPNRRYKKPKRREAALSELSSLAGTHFRPEVVRALLRVAGG